MGTQGDRFPLNGSADQQPTLRSISQLEIHLVEVFAVSQTGLVTNITAPVSATLFLQQLLAIAVYD